jgi:hypothetical protein
MSGYVYMLHLFFAICRLHFGNTLTVYVAFLFCEISQGLLINTVQTAVVSV